MLGSLRFFRRLLKNRLISPIIPFAPLIQTWGLLLFPIKEQITSLESQIVKAKQQENQINATAMPSKEEIELFTEESVKTLPDLNFELKRAIIIDVVERIVGTQQKLKVNGYLPVISNYVEYKTIGRNRGAS